VIPKKKKATCLTGLILHVLPGTEDDKHGTNIFIYLFVEKANKVWAE
jgi:hypothetical protein